MALNSWTIDTAHSSINFSARHMVFAKVRGRFGSWGGTIQLDEDELTGSSVEVEIDAGSIDTGVADRDQHLRSGDFLNVEQFPKLSFKSQRIERRGKHYRIYGELTIRDVTRPVTLDAEYGGQARDRGGNQRAAFAATTSIERRAFGLKWNQALEAGGVLVGERVDVEIEVQAIKG